MMLQGVKPHAGLSIAHLQQKSIRQKQVEVKTPIRFGQDEPFPLYPDPITFKDELQRRAEKAALIARTAGEIIMSYFKRGLRTQLKAGDEIFTAADSESDQFIREKVAQHFPGDDLLTEESVKPGQQVNLNSAWVIDPLDGSKNFKDRLPSFAVSMAYFKDGKPTIGVIHEPLTKETFVGIAGRPAFLAESGEPIQVQEASKIEKNTILGMTYPIPAKLAGLKTTIRRLGSTAVDMAYVADGRLLASCEKGLKPWDIAAGIALVEAAGGKVTDFKGQPIDFRVLDLSRDKVNYVASNGKVHDAMIELTKDYPV